MNGFKKLVLASAVLAASTGAFAMEAMDDESMSTTTGQDGLTITLDSSIQNLVITYVDRDGLAGGSFNDAGALVIGDTTNGVDVSIVGLRIDIDVGGSAGTSAGSGMLNIGIGMTSMNIGLGNVVIGVADASNTAGSQSVGAVKGILSFDASASLNIAGNASLMNIQLGNEEQGSMVKMSANLGTITLTGLSINDVTASGSITVGRLIVSNLQAVNTIDVDNTDLVINTAGTTIGTIGMEDVKLGDKNTVAEIGDIYISNLNANSTIRIHGH